MKFFKDIKNNRGMTYVELIVVLSIFSIMSSIMMFNYGSFQAKVDIKNLTSDIGLKLVQAQKYSISGRLPPALQQSYIADINNWKPSYGVHFNTTTDNKSFTYFADLDSNNLCDTTCGSYLTTGEFLEKMNINKGNFISKMEVIDPSGTVCPITELTILFKRPNSGATITAASACTIKDVEITVSSSGSSPATAKVLVYPSGRIQLN